MLALWFALLQVSVYAPTQAADHVVQMEALDFDGRLEEGRIVAYRSGSLLRVEQTSRFGSETTYADLAGDTSLLVRRNPAGAIVSLRLNRERSSLQWQPSTGRQDRLLGSACAVSRYQWAGSDSGGETCATADGILLWQATIVSRPIARTDIRLRATTIERRPVGRAELLPPRTMLEDAMAVTSPAPPISAQTDYEVELIAADPAEGSRILRHHGSFFSEAWQVGGRRFLWVLHGAVSVGFAEDESGQPMTLAVNEGGPDEFVLPASMWQPVRGSPSEHLLGETCTWHVDIGIANDVRFYQCQTHDGIPLKTATWSDWSRTFRRSTASHISRRPLSDADFALPARALDWASWGITPAP